VKNVKASGSAKSKVFLLYGMLMASEYACGHVCRIARFMRERRNFLES